MTLPAMTPALERLVRFYEGLTPSTLERVTSVYACDASFVDPFNDVVGTAAIAQVFRHLFDQVDAPRFAVVETYEDGSRAALLWSMKFRFRGERDERVIEGMSRVEFDAEGRVISHRDFWDSASQLYAKMPVIGRLVAPLTRHLSASR